VQISDVYGSIPPDRDVQSQHIDMILILCICNNKGILLNTLETFTQLSFESHVIMYSTMAHCYLLLTTLALIVLYYKLLKHFTNILIHIFT